MYARPYAHPYAQSHSQLHPSFDPAPQSQLSAMAHPQPSVFQDGSAPVFRACSSAMQRPTLTNVRIRSTRDAHQIFYAVLRNLLPMTVRRLDAEERRAITSGNVYVWEERGASSEATGLGIERWTDGMRWSPSRVRDEFLFYHQKEMDPEEAADLPPTRWARIVRPKDTGSDGASPEASPDRIPHQRALNDPEKLIKQTYSVLVALPEDRQRGILRKWHLTAYFTQSTVDKLSTVDEVLPKPHVMVPEGLFRSARAGKIRRDTGTGRQQQQQRQTAYYGPEAAGPSTSLPLSGHPSAASSSSLSPHQASYSHIHPYPYPRSQVQYSAYVQDEVDARRLSLPPVAGGAYAIVPALPPPPPRGQGSIDAQTRGLGITYSRSPREWDRGEQEGGSVPQLRHERERRSPQRYPQALPNTYDPTCGHVSGIPPQSHSPSFSHPYANALQRRVVRMSDADVECGSSSASLVASSHSASRYYLPAKPIEPIDVSLSQKAQSTPSPVSADTSNGPLPLGEGGCALAESADAEIETELDEQRQPSIGPARGLSSPSPHRKNCHLPPVRPHASPKSLPSSISNPGPSLRPASASGPSALLGGTTDQVASRPSLASSRLNLEEERARSLVPLDSLENALFPRRDPTDDALLRRFNALRTTPPGNSVRDE